METEISFDIGLGDYSVHRLWPEDVEAIQGLFEKCLDYFLVVEGQGPAPNAAEGEIQSVPPGKSQDDKFIFGIVNEGQELVGLLEGLRRYPDESTWWIGLLLIAPEIRAQGIGQRIVQGFAEFVQASGGHAIILGVVNENQRAYEFWKRIGFEAVRKTEPRQFGNKTQAVRVMRRALLDARLPMESRSGH